MVDYTESANESATTFTFLVSACARDVRHVSAAGNMYNRICVSVHVSIIWCQDILQVRCFKASVAATNHRAIKLLLSLHRCVVQVLSLQTSLHLLANSN